MDGKSISKDSKIAAGQFAKEKEYWINKLSGESENCYFPYDNYIESTAGEYRKALITFNISGELYGRLMKITGGSYPKIHIVLTAGAVSLSTHYTGNHDMIVGTSIETQDVEGSLINTTLPLRISMQAHMTFKELILEIRSTINEAIEHQNYPIEILYPPEKGGLFDVVVLLENIQKKKYIQHLQSGIIFSFRAVGNEVEGELEYDISKYEKESIERIIRHYLQLLRVALFDVNVKISDIQLLSQKDREELSRFNCTRTEYPYQKTIHELFEEQAEKTPGNIALVDGNHESPQQITYRGLNEKSNRLAQWLKQKSVEPGSIVGIMIEPSLEMITGIMGILKAGGAYLPIDPDYPQERIDYMLKDSGAKILLTASDLKSVFEPSLSTLTLTSTCQVSPTNLAYIIYTSGSTGKPKGVAVEHRALVNYAWWAAQTYVKNEKVNFPLYTSIGFDLTITSLFTPFITGNTIYIYRGERKEFLLDKLFDENKVEAVKLTPVHLMVTGDTIREKNLSKIKRFIVGGEKLETQWARKIHENFEGNIEIYNEYGPTEAAVGCMIHKYNPLKDKGASVPIGIPADNVQIYLLNKNMKDVPVGGIGQLYIAGDGLARGYLNKPELTREKFRKAVISHSSLVIGSSSKTNDRSSKFSTNDQCPITNDRLYQTGDMARRLPDGNIEFLGRQDQQVKVRGYRIETGEIENYLLKHDHITQAVVTAKNDKNGYKYLAAYIVLSGKEEANDIDTGELREYLAKYLPDFMIPSYFVKLEKIPVTTNGKIDKKSLPDPDKNALETGTEYQHPTTELEEIMVEIWQDVTGVERVGINDGYFALGGDSIKSIQILARLHNVGWKLELQDLFRYTTIKELVNYIKPLKEIPNQEMVEGEVKLTPIQEWFFERNFTDEHHFNLSIMLHRPEGFNEEILKKVFSKLVEHHDALRLVFKREKGKIKQINRGFYDDLVHIEVFDMKSENDYKKLITETCSQLQGSIDLSGGPLVRPGLFKSKNGDYLLITIHHLVMDTVSWRFLFEDFASLYKQIENGVEKEKLEIPFKSTSYKEWAEKLYEYSNSEGLINQLKYWQKIENTELFDYSKNKGRIRGKNKDSRKISFELTEKSTEKLLKQVNNAYNTEINDILLAALGLAVSDWAGVEEVPLTLEGHGREEIIPGVDITRTVGWFTSIYPVVIDMKNRDDIASIIKDTKEMLRNVPSKGFGYGILKYLTSEENKRNIKFSLNPEISFNYLGQFEGDKNTESFQVADISAGNYTSLNMERIYPIYILGSIFGGKFGITVNYDGRGFEENDIRVFLDGYERRLLQIIDHCTTKQDTEFTLSDYSVPIAKQEFDLVLDVLSNIKPDG